MGSQFRKIAFTESVKQVQALMGSRKNYAREEASPSTNDKLTENETSFIAERDSFYMSSVSETGWPYVQHRGGPKGFLKILSETEIGFADYTGNRQYISVGNVNRDSRVSIILVDYPNQARLKIFGIARIIDQTTEQELMSKLISLDYNARVERAFIIEIKGFDWNCPQHITPRWTADDIQKAVTPLKLKIEQLENQLREKSRLK